MVAAQEGRTNAVDLLLRAGASVEVCKFPVRVSALKQSACAVTGKTGLWSRQRRLDFVMLALRISSTPA